MEWGYLELLQQELQDVGAHLTVKGLWTKGTRCLAPGSVMGAGVVQVLMGLMSPVAVLRRPLAVNRCAER